MLDLVHALEWVRDNITGFGGDPGNVTIFGESGGASKIASILAMPKAKGLFHKAVLQSSAGGMTAADPQEAEASARRLARALDRPALEAAELQRLPMATVLAAAEAAGPFRSTIDGRSLHGDPFGTEAPKVSGEVPLFVGCTETEATYYLRNDARNFALGSADVRGRLARFFEADLDTVDRITETYRAVYPALDPSGILAMIASDYMFKRNGYRMAALQADAGLAPVYAFLFTRRTPVEGGRMGSPHTSEVPFIFGTAEAAAAHVGAGPDIDRMTASMMQIWAAFARTGNPACAAVPDWPRYRKDARSMAVLDLDCRIEDDPGGAARAALEPLPFFGYGHRIAALNSDA